MPSVRRKVKSQSAGAPLWIVTFSDLMTLLLTFFVLLLSFSAIKLDSFRAAMGSLKEALGVFQGSQSVLYAPADVTSNIPTKAEILKATAEIRALINDYDGPIYLMSRFGHLKEHGRILKTFDLSIKNVNEGIPIETDREPPGSIHLWQVTRRIVD